MWVNFKQSRGLSTYFDITPRLNKALLLQDIAEQHWWTPLSHCKDLPEGFHSIDAKTRNKVLKFFCERGPSDILRELLNADAMMRGEYHSVIKRANDRLDHLTWYVADPPNGRTKDDPQVVDATNNLTIVREFLAELEGLHTSHVG